MKDQNDISRRAIVGGEDSDQQKAGFFARLIPAWVRELPPNVPRHEATKYYTRFAVPVVGGALHSILIAVYLSLGVQWMAYVNLLSVGIFVIAAGLVRSGRHYLGTAVAILEACIHAPVVTYFLGVEAGYLLFNFIVAMCASLTYSGSEWKERYAVVTYLLVSSALVIVLSGWVDPLVKLEEWQLRTILYLIAFSSFMALCVFAHYFISVSEAAERRVERELARSEALLLNILPRPIAERLKRQPGTIADNFACVSVLFADIVGFTKLSSTASGAQVVEMLNEVFSAFDRIAAKYGLEKIKTIGDAYLIVGGIPHAMPDHAQRVLLMALEMEKALLSSAAARAASIQIRIGVHSGPVVAGVIGEQKFAYDLWGDTVNVASRMESHGLPGRVQISESTAALVRDQFDLEDRGAIEIKGKGQIKTYFVLGAKSAMRAA